MIWLTGICISLLLLLAEFQLGPFQVHNIGELLFMTGVATLAAPVFVLLQPLVIRLGRQSRRTTPGTGARIRAWNETATFLVWLSASATIIFVIHWPVLVRSHWNLDRWPLVDEIMIALPSCISLAAVWLLSLHAESRASNTFRINRVVWNEFCQRIRTTGGLVVIPVLLLFLVRDLAAGISGEFQSGLVTGAGFSILLLGLWVLYPLIVSATWPTAPLSDESLRLKLDNICQARGIKPESVRVWDTGGTIINAMVVGMVPGFRRILLTDELLRQFEQREICAIFRHELGHLVFRHMWIRSAILLGPVAFGGLIFALIYGAETGHWTINGLESRWWLVWMLAPVLAIVWLTLVVIPVLRNSELQADRYAVLDRNGDPSPQLLKDYCDALMKFGLNHPQMLGRSGGLHPGIRARIRILQQFGPDSQVGLKSGLPVAGVHSPLVGTRNDLHIGCSKKPKLNTNQLAEKPSCRAPTPLPSRETR